MFLNVLCRLVTKAVLLHSLYGFDNLIGEYICLGIDSDSRCLLDSTSQ